MLHDIRTSKTGLTRTPARGPECGPLVPLYVPFCLCPSIGDATPSFPLSLFDHDFPPPAPPCVLCPLIFMSLTLSFSRYLSLSLCPTLSTSPSHPPLSLYLSLPLSLSQVQRWFLLLCVSQLLSRAPYCTVSLQVVAKSLIFCECQPYLLSLKGLNGMGK